MDYTWIIRPEKHIFYLLSSIFYLLSSIFHLPSSIFYLLSSIFYLILTVLHSILYLHTLHLLHFMRHTSYMIGYWRPMHNRKWLSYNIKCPRWCCQSRSRVYNTGGVWHRSRGNNRPRIPGASGNLNTKWTVLGRKPSSVSTTGWPNRSVSDWEGVVRWIWSKSGKQWRERGRGGEDVEEEEGEEEEEEIAM